MEVENFDRVVHSLALAKDKEGQPLRLQSIILSDPDRSKSFTFSQTPSVVDIRSISKVALALCVGIAIERQLKIYNCPMNLDTKILPSLKKLGLLISEKEFCKVSILHALTNTIGYEKGFLFRKDIGDRDYNNLLKYIASVPLIHSPGAHFSYSNVGPYLVSVLFDHELGIPLDKFAQTYLFSKLKIHNVEWKKYGSYVAGCSGLVMSNEDLHKLGRLIADDGAYEGEQIVSKNWIQVMTGCAVPSPEKFEPSRALPKQKYGLGLWVTPSGNIYCDGTDGQYLIIIPSKKRVITTIGQQPDMKPITECMKPLLS